MIKSLAKIAGYFPKQILGLRYFKWTHKRINWRKPRDIQQYIFSDYIRRYKNRQLTELADLTDKYKVRQFVKERVGEKYLTRLYGFWESADDIDFEKLPDKFVMKTNNGCATNIIVRDKSKDLDINKAKADLKRWLTHPYGALSGQPHYSLIKPGILAEEFLVQEEGKESLPFDYKFFCFNGQPLFILFYEGRKANSHHSLNMVYDTEWNALPHCVNHPTPEIRPKPQSFDEMLEIARKLSKGFKFVRVDLYEINGRPVFGEMTFTPDMITNFTPDFLDIDNGFVKSLKN